ncbi:MAG: MFS transporter [Actinomycetota bacterium]
MRLLRSRDFRFLVVSNGLSSLGDELALVALTIKVFDISHSGIAVSAVLLAGIVPLVLFSPLAGSIVDRTESTGTLAIASAMQAGLAVGLAFVHPVWAIVALSFLLGSVASVASPAVFAIMPMVVDEEDLTEANANMETARYIGMVAGPIIAGGLAAATGKSDAALLVDAITFLVITSAAASLAIRRPPDPTEHGRRQKGEARRGFSFLAHDRVLLIAVVAIAATVLFAAMDNVAEVFFARNVLNAGNWGYGALAAVWLAGMVVGAAVIARRLPEARLAPAILVASFGGGVAVAIAAVFPAVALALSMFALGGVANGVVTVSMRSLLHHRVPDQLRGRVYSAYFGVVMAGQLGATALGGVLVALLHSRAVLLIGGLGGAVVGLIGLVFFGALPSSARASNVVIVPETEPVERRLVVVRDLMPQEDTAEDTEEELADEPVEVLPSVEPSS